MNYPVTAADVSKKRISHYKVWDGEVFVTVTKSCGAHGFFSAAMVVEHCDSPLECFVYDGYSSELRSTQAGSKGPNAAYAAMQQWIAEQLTRIATGTQFATGTTSDVVETHVRAVDEMQWQEFLPNIEV